MTDTDIKPFIEAQNQLKRCLSRLSFVGMGISKELDPLLTGLRTAIKTDVNIEEINDIVDQISKALRSVDEPEIKSKIEVINNEMDILSLLLKESLPSELINNLRKAQPTEPVNDAAHIARSIVEAINSYLQELNVELETRPEKKGFLSGLFGKTTEADELNDTPDIAHQKISHSLKVSLQHLVGQLSIMEDYSEVGLKLTEKVNSVTLVEELSEILELITGAFVEVSDLEHQQFENFLKSLNKRIDQVNGFINHTVEYSIQVADSSKKLNTSLQGSVLEIKDSFDSSGSTSLEVVKNSLYEKLDSISSKVSLFTVMQEKNQSGLNEELENIREQLRATEDESSRLRDDLAAQRIRAHTDSLTQLPNRYSYNERLTQEYNRWRRYRSPLSVVIGDIDLFKEVNDNYGHTAGDEVLRQVSGYLQSSLRESDFIARFGGEEFIILLPETTLVDSAKAINKLRQGIKEIKIEVERQMISVAMSFGISEFESSDTPKAVFSRADKALYRAKEKGRDQVCCQRSKSE